MADAFETAHTTFDRLEAEMVAEALVREGIDARLIGTTGAALIGAAPHIVRLRIEVPAEDAAAAREIVAAMLSGVEGEGAAAAEAAAVEAAAAAPEAAGATTPADDADEAGAPGPRRRHPLVAAGAAFVLPGGSHIYARHPWSGLVLAAAFVATLVALVGARRHASVAAGALTLVGLLLADLVGGQLAVRRANHGAIGARPRQLLRGLVLAAVAITLGVLAGAFVPPPKPKVDPLLEQLQLLQPRPRTAPLELQFFPPELEGLRPRPRPASQPLTAPIAPR